MFVGGPPRGSGDFRGQAVGGLASLVFDRKVFPTLGWVGSTAGRFTPTNILMVVSYKKEALSRQG